jgi:hypothetical protein
MEFVLFLELIPAVLAIIIFAYSRHETAKLADEVRRRRHRVRPTVVGAPVRRVEPQGTIEPTPIPAAPVRYSAPRIDRIVPVLYAQDTETRVLWNGGQNSNSAAVIEQLSRASCD